MKNAFKLSLLTLAITLSLAACKGNKSGNSADTAKIDSSTSVKSTTDSTIKKTDTTKMAPDSASMKPDTTTTSKTVSKTTEVKKVVVKKK